jgi:sporulation protein YlmC with PRC-barrel domain
MDRITQTRLQELDRSGFEIVKGEPDIRGWDVRYFTGQKLGSVEELILDAQEKKVRYIVVDLQDNDLKLVRRKLLIPIGLAELDHKEDDVLIPNISLEQLSRLPDYDRDNLSPGFERRISSTLGRENYSTVNEYDDLDSEFYRHEHYNPDNLYKKRIQDPDLKKRNIESDYDRGLRLWERRSENNILDEKNIELTDEEREEILRRRRNNYRERRYKDRNI